ncbi:zinc ribbon domain-containing protein [Streptomyces blattellae]|uniref:zinc ribbon domain-containing protein n=1 Tax=Streptomyces blattellae TaxID=2569855 RepID=UPI0038B4AB87
MVRTSRASDSDLPISFGVSSTRGPLPLGVRTWTCEGCGTQHDRDHNAAQNIVAAGQAVSACGGRVSPQRKSSGRAAGDEAGNLMARAVRAPAPRGAGRCHTANSWNAMVFSTG